MIWTVLGMSVAVIAGFCVAVAELFVGHTVFESNRKYIALGFGICGVLGWFIGRSLSRKRLENKSEDDDSKLFVLFDLRYWGPMLAVLGIITFFIQSIRKEVIVAAMTATPKKIEVIVAPPKPQPTPPVTFPALRVQGVMLDKNRTHAIINGKPYAVGDRVGDVTVTEITREGVTVEKLGEVKLLSLR